MATALKEPAFPLPLDIAPKGARIELTPCDMDAVMRLERELGIDFVVAQVLVRRGFEKPEQARSLLTDQAQHDWRMMQGAKELAATLLAHSGADKKIVIHGDYDVDGISSTALLVRSLERVGARVTWHVPSRFGDGYGLSKAAIDRFKSDGATMILSVDCGITALDEVMHARALGLEIAICDHHIPDGGDNPRLPDCQIVHPALGGYPMPSLCATAVAYKLAQALFDAVGLDPALLDDELDLVALATVCDVMPLIGENRTLVRSGLRQLARSKRPGLTALMKVAGVDPLAADATTFGFRLGPRINAVGRMFSADPAVELMLTEDEDRARELATELDLANTHRRMAEQKVLFEAQSMAARQRDQYALVVAGEQWHAGVLGIVAGKLAQRYRRPTLALAIDGEAVGGSGRSGAGFDLLEGLRDSSEQLIRFGGHRQAAGLELSRSNLDTFRERFQKHAAEVLDAEDLKPRLIVDAIASPGQMNLAGAAQIAALEPFGMSNDEPVVLLPGVRVFNEAAIGATKEHVRCVISGDGGDVSGVAFGTGGRLPGAVAAPGCANHAVVKLRRNEWRGSVSPQLLIEQIVSATGDGASKDPEEPGHLGDPAASTCHEWLERFTSGLEHDPEGLSAGTTPWWQEGRCKAKVIDRRGQSGIALAINLALSGEPTALVVGDQPQAALLRDSLTGLPGGDALECVAAATLAGQEPAWADVVLLEPLTIQDNLESITRVGTTIYLAWSEAASEATAARVTDEFDLRSQVADLYRVIRDRQELRAADLPDACSAAIALGESPLRAARALRILDQLGLVAVEQTPTGVVIKHVSHARTALDRSAVFRSYSALEEEARTFLNNQTAQL